MDILTVLNRKEIVIQKIFYHMELFKSFKNLYLFGSIISDKKNPNDIDLLLIYEDFSNALLRDLDEIRTIFEKLYGFSFDLNVLSEKEEEESNFLSKLKTNYLRLK